MVAWFGFELFPLNKVPLVFINHGGGYSVEIRSSASRKANRLPFSQVFKYTRTFRLRLEFIFEPELPGSLDHPHACFWAQYWNKPFPRRGSVGEFGRCTLLSECNLTKECASPAGHLGHGWLCHVAR